MSSLLKKIVLSVLTLSFSVTVFAQNVEHVIKRSESLKSIAQAYNVSEKAILEANPDLSPNFLVIGSTIIIPCSSTKTVTQKNTVDTETKTSSYSPANTANQASSNKTAKQQKGNTVAEPQAIFSYQQSSQQEPDVIVKRTGETILAKVTRIGANQIEYKKWSNLDGPTYEISKSEVVSINYANGTKDDFLTKETIENFDIESKKSTTHTQNYPNVQPEEESSEEELSKEENNRGWGGGLQIGTFPVTHDGGNDRIGIDADYHFSSYFFVGGQAFFDVGLPYYSDYDVTVFGLGLSPHVGVHLPLFGNGYASGISLYTGPSSAINLGGKMKKNVKDSEKIRVSGGGFYSDWMVGIKFKYGIWISAEYHANLVGSNAFNSVSYFCIGIGLGI